MKVALVHDDLVQWGGLERILEALTQIFPDAPIFTSIFDKQNEILTEKFSNRKVITSFIQKIPLGKVFYKTFLPLYPLAFESFNFDGYDVIISLTTRFSKSVLTKPNQLHICYCFTPPRFLWRFPADLNTLVISLPISLLRLYDRVSSNRVDKWIAGSSNIQERIQKIYRKDSVVIPGFVDTSQYKTETAFKGGYYLIISRLNNYKRIDIAIAAFNKIQYQDRIKTKKLKIVGIGPAKQKLVNMSSSVIEFLGAVNEDDRIRLLAGCEGLIVTAEEDFGLTPLEAQVLGKGVIAFRKGGVLETVIENKTGVFFQTQTPDCLMEAIYQFENAQIDSEKCQKNASRFSKDDFNKQFKKLLQDYISP